VPEPRVTTTHWNQPPHNRWSFQHMQSLFPTARLRRGLGPAQPFSSQAKDLLAAQYETGSGEQRSVSQSLAETYTDAFLVARGDQLLLEHYENGMAADSLHLLNSVTKSFTGMLAGILVADGRLAAEDAVTRWLPELGDTAFADTCVQHLLDMTAAPAYGEDYSDVQADFWQEAAVVGWRPDLVGVDSPRTLLEYAATLQAPDQPDGQAFHYRSVLTNVLGMVLERAGGAPLQTLLQNALWQPLGPEQDANIVVDPIGFPYVAAGMSAGARDLLRFGQLLIQQGRYGGRQLLPAGWIDQTVNVDPKWQDMFAASEYGDFIPGGHYRNQMWVRRAERGQLLALGIHGQIIYMDSASECVIVKLSTQPEATDLQMFTDNFAAMDAVVAAL